MNASQPQSQTSQRVVHRASQSTSTTHAGPNGAGGRAFTRTLSIGEEKRRAAIEQSLGMDPSASQVRRFHEHGGHGVESIPEAGHVGNESGSSKTVGQDNLIRAELETSRKLLEKVRTLPACQ
jgi:hypothetical protein